MLLQATGHILRQAAANAVAACPMAAVIHASVAVLAIAIWIIHVYAAIWVRGTISAMTRGLVSGGWGWRHHRKWLRKEVDRGEIERPTAAG